ncbi:uncharacterized protein LOC117924021 [Vitis riparia]|uniref:uncharacterized protein LOC117924021 n=1 Tax=Vitis riparia TaxID=96939 RepID=UPI00155B1E42|nr:uncharacterized protein LOC117924021 [Vitis riparia]
MKIQGGAHSPARFPPNGPTSSSGLNLNVTADARLRRRKTRRPGSAGAGFRMRRSGTPAGRGSVLTTPLLRWKFDDDEFGVGAGGESVAGRRGVRRVRSGGEVDVSARRLAAGLWHLSLAAESSGGGGGGRGGGKGGDLQCASYDRLGLESGRITKPYHQHGPDIKDLLQSPPSLSGPKNGILSKVESSLPLSKSALERATKWDSGYSRSSDEFGHFYSQMKLHEDGQLSTVSVVSTLQAELLQARTRIHELEAERHSFKKKLEHFLKKVNEDRTSWQSREQQKIRGIIDDLKDKLNIERKNRQRMEILNSKLVNELADAKLSMKEFMQEYEKERKGRELMEEVCNELAKEIGEDKAEVESFKREYVKIREEVEEERKMLQMAEVWREERVQMKLVDAKLTLENKYCQMKKLVADLETFLSSRSATLDVMELRHAELIRQAVNSVKIQDIKEFSYAPPKTDDIFSIFEELKNGEANGREIEPCTNYNPPTHASKIQNGNPEVNRFSKSPLQKCPNGFVDHNRCLEEDASGWETVSRAEDQGSIYSLEGSDYSVNRFSQGRNASRSGIEWDENAGQDSPHTATSEVCSVSAKQSKQTKQNASSVSKLWRSCSSNGEIYKIISDEGNARLSNGTITSVGTMSPSRGLGEGGLSHQDLVDQWSSPETGNPHVTRGVKGCTEHPQGTQSSLKAKLLEARMESQKIQLRQVLKQRS